ncbi:MAG: polysaccharide pyruvyl transferase family protein [Acidobacteria bacterium]|nr:polysaccharide pyruvyl transferase family protein [Acidobacteriota bacterium]
MKYMLLKRGIFHRRGCPEGLFRHTKEPRFNLRKSPGEPLFREEINRLFIRETAIVTRRANIGNTVHAGTCIGCGCCAVICPVNAVTIHWTNRCEYIPRVDESLCTDCGLCSSTCPNNPRTLREDAERISSCDPWTFGMDGADFFLAWDPEPERRHRSASGGAVTALLRHLLKTGLADAVIHGEPIEGSIGKPHFRAGISTTAQECEARRGSFYHPICYNNVLEFLPGSIRRVAVVGVPCVIKAVRNLWEAKPEYSAISLVTVALACSHNVNGQFIDLLAETVGLSPRVSFDANLRNKDGIPDANNFNIRFDVSGRQVSLENRYRSLFTHAWREYWFAMGCCHLCSDFWGHRADITVKDAWGHWASDPLGKSIVILRNSNLRDAFQNNTELTLEPLDKSVVAHCQEPTVEYKQIRIMDRFNKPWWSRENRKSGYLRYRLASFLSRICYTHTTAKITRRLLFTLMGRPKHTLPAENFDAETTTKRGMNRLRRFLWRRILHERRSLIVCWGTGSLGRDVGRALAGRIGYFVDSDPRKQDTSLLGVPVRSPSFLKKEREADLLILIASVFEEQIRRQITDLELSASIRILAVNPLLLRAQKDWALEGKTNLQDWIKKLPWIKSREHRPKRKSPWYRQKKILVAGGYGYRNAGDEAQLAATLRELSRRFPDYLIKVLTPDLRDTHFLHDACLVGEASRLAFYDLDISDLYSLPTRGKKFRFLFRSFWLLINAWFIKNRIPISFVNARRTALLYEIATADLIFFCGGGYLTGKTLSRLWDGMFVLRLAHLFGTPSVLSGQTIGVWNSRFSRWLAGWGLKRAHLVATRDSNASVEALQNLGISPSKVMTTCDDALFMENPSGIGALRSLLDVSNINPSIVDSRFIVLNLHYWGFNEDSDRRWLLDRAAAILRCLAELDPVPVVGLPMTAIDEQTLLDLEKNLPDAAYRMLRYNKDYRIARALISLSHACITMKHHPIIFALGERVPVISLAHGAYYEHKNAGALGLFDLADCSIRLEENNYLQRFEALYRNICKNRSSIVKKIENGLPPLSSKRNIFFDRISSLLSGTGVNLQ